MACQCIKLVVFGADPELFSSLCYTQSSARSWIATKLSHPATNTLGCVVHSLWLTLVQSLNINRFPSVLKTPLKAADMTKLVMVVRTLVKSSDTMYLHVTKWSYLCVKTDLRSSWIVEVASLKKGEIQFWHPLVQGVGNCSQNIYIHSSAKSPVDDNGEV